MERLKIRLWTLLLLLLTYISSGKAECVKPVLEGNVVLTNEAILKNNFPEGSDVTVECANGYEVDNGSDRITCKDGKWSELELVCKKKDCRQPRPSPNLRYEMPDGTLFGSFIRPVCDRGYELQGSSYRQCLANGWGGRSKCELVLCEYPSEINNGKITLLPAKDYPEFEDIIEYSCDPNYTLIGNRSISCEADGKYSSQPPQCIAISTTKSDTKMTETTTTIIRMITNRISTSTSPSTSPSTISTNLEGRENDLLPLIVVLITIVGGTLIVACCVLLHYYYKRKGSYDTGEALKTKEELIQKRSRYPVLL